MRTALLVMLFAAAGCGTAWVLTGRGQASSPTTAPVGQSITLTDMAGRTVTIKQPVERIVLIRSRDIYEVSMLIPDDIEKKLVAWGPDIQSADKDACEKFVARYPSLAKLPVLGSVFEDAVSPEAVMALKPDLVVMDTFMLERGYKCVGALERSGLPLFFMDTSHDPFRGPQLSLLLLGKALGCQARAEAIAAFVDAEQDKVFARLEKLSGQQPSVYLECGSQGVQSFGSTYGCSKGQRLSSWGTVLDRLHCRNIAAGFVSNMAQINPEYILSENPDVIVVTGAYWSAAPDSMRLGYCVDAAEARRRLAAFTNRPGWGGLKAVKAGRVYSLFHGFCMHPTNFAAVQQLAKWLHPGEFADLEPEARLREFHRQYMPIEMSGTWAISLEPANGQ